MVINHLMYVIHASFSFHRGDNVCPFSCEKGLHDADLLKAHIQERKCLLAKEFDNIQEAIRYQAEMEPHLQRAQSSLLTSLVFPVRKAMQHCKSHSSTFTVLGADTWITGTFAQMCLL